jgi:hypothetical protein
MDHVGYERMEMIDNIYVEVRDRYGHMPLSRASEAEYRAVVELLLMTDSDFNTKDNWSTYFLTQDSSKTKLH